MPIVVTLSSPDLTDELCLPLDAGGGLSCWNQERSVLNAKRWELGANSYDQDLVNYRRYLSITR